MQGRTFLITWKADYFQQKLIHKIQVREPTLELAIDPSTYNKSKLKLRQEFLNEIIADEKYINNEIFSN